MLKLIIFSLLGKNIVSSRVLFNSIKSYLIIYMLVLPAFLSARVVHRNIPDHMAPVFGEEVTVTLPESIAPKQNQVFESSDAMPVGSFAWNNKRAIVY